MYRPGHEWQRNHVDSRAVRLRGQRPREAGRVRAGVLLELPCASDAVPVRVQSTDAVPHRVHAPDGLANVVADGLPDRVADRASDGPNSPDTVPNQGPS